MAGFHAVLYSICPCLSATVSRSLRADCCSSLLSTSWDGTLAQPKAAVPYGALGSILIHGQSQSLWDIVCRVSESCGEIFAIYSQSRGDIFGDAYD